MTRIRKNWSSSRGTEDVESPPSHAAVSNDFPMVDTEGKPKSPLVQLVDEDAMHMLAAVSLESLEQDCGIRNLKRENASAQVMAAMNAKSLERDANAQNGKLEKRASGKVWDRSYRQGGLVGKRGQPDQWYQKLSDIWHSDHGPASLPKTFARRDAVDEEQSKSSSVADNEMGDCDLSARMERAKRNLSAAEPMRGVVTDLMQARCIERDPRNEETSRIVDELFPKAGLGRKRRQHKPWGSESDLPSTVHDNNGCRRTTDQKTPNNSVNSAVISASVSFKRRLKIVRTSQDDGTIRDAGDNTRAEPAKVAVTPDHGTGNVNKVWSKQQLPKASTDDNDDNEHLVKEVPDNQGNKNLFYARSVSKFPGHISDEDDNNEPEAKANEEEEDEEGAKEGAEDAVDDSSPLNAKAEKVSHAIEDGRKRHREKPPPQELGTDASDRKRVRVKVSKVESSSAQQNGAQNGSGEDMFPTGWKYKGLAQIAEKDEVTNGQVKKLCGRTDGHNWRCPLRVVEGFSLCQHHLNKARAKKMGKNGGSITPSHPQPRKESERKKQRPEEVSPHTSDSASFEPYSLPSDPHVPTKSRRRHKTAKLSVL